MLGNVVHGSGTESYLDGFYFGSCCSSSFVKFRFKQRDTEGFMVSDLRFSLL